MAGLHDKLTGRAARLRRPATGPPDFVGIGTQRSGTTWWFERLLDHPAIAPPESRAPKELHFFNRFCAQEFTERHVQGYHQRFPVRPGKISGEWTPRYMFDFWTPRLIARAAPDAKLLVLLRDPIERFKSGYAHQMTTGLPGRPEVVSFNQALDRGRYAFQLEHVLEHFPREQVLVQQYERCRADPLAEYARTLRFLGVADDFEPEDLRRMTGRPTGEAKRPLWADVEAVLRAELEPDVRRLTGLLGDDLDLALWPNFAHLAAAR